MGGPTIDQWRADTAPEGTWTYTTTDRVDVSKASDAAPESIYQSERAGEFGYRVNGLTPNTEYAVRLHFAEIYFDRPGQRVFTVQANGIDVLPRFDVVAEAGGPDIAVTREVNAVSGADGSIELRFVAIENVPKISGMEVLTCSRDCPGPGTVPTPTPTPSNEPPKSPPPGTPPAFTQLRVSADGRGLVNAEGQPFVWQADTAWALTARGTRDDIVRYLDTRKAQGFNVVQTVAIFPPEGDHTSAIGVGPVNGSVSSRNEAYWQHVDFMVAEAERRGIYVALLPVWLNDYANNVISSNNAQEYGRFLGERYRSNKIVWVLGGDAPQYHESITRELAKGIAIGVSGGEDYTKVLMTYHPGGTRTSSAAFHNDAWLDFNMDQSGHCFAYSTEFVPPDYAKSPAKPVIDGEPLYEDHPHCWDPARGYSTPEQVRLNLYQGPLAGAFGFTYGNHAVWQMYSPRYAPLLGVRDGNYWYDALNHEVANDAVLARRLFESRPVATRVPDQSVLTSDAGSREQRVQAARGSDGAYLMVYTPGRAFSVNLDTLSGDTARLWWFDPRTGTARDAGTAASQGTRNLTPPSAEGWVLVADDAARGFGAPGATA